jgi:hypothetical protein
MKWIRLKRAVDGAYIWVNFDYVAQMNLLAASTELVYFDGVSLFVQEDPDGIMEILGTRK